MATNYQQDDNSPSGRGSKLAKGLSGVVDSLTQQPRLGIICSVVNAQTSNL